VFDSGFMIC